MQIRLIRQNHTDPRALFGRDHLQPESRRKKFNAHGCRVALSDKKSPEQIRVDGWEFSDFIVYMQRLGFLKGAFIVLIFAGIARSEIVRYAFEGHITSAGQPSPIVAIGTPVSGVISVDTSAPDTDPRPENATFSSPGFSYSIAAGQYQFSSLTGNTSWASDVPVVGGKYAQFSIFNGQNSFRLGDDSQYQHGPNVPQSAADLNAFTTLLVSSPALGTYGMDNAEFRRIPAAGGLTLKGDWTMDSHEGRRVEVSGNYAYVVTTVAMFKIFDLTDPLKPVETAEVALGNSIVTADVVVSGDYAYLAAPIPNNPAWDVRIVAVASKTNPQVVSGFVEEGNAQRLAIDGGNLYVGSNAGLSIYSLANPTQPQKLGSYSGLDVRAIAVRDGLAYVAAGTQGIVILDVSAPTAISRVGGTALADSDEAIDLVLSGNYAEVAANTAAAPAQSVGRLRIVDVSNPAAPVEVYASAPLEQRQMKSIEHIGSHAVIGGGSLHVIDTTNPLAPVEKSTLALRMGVTEIEALNGRLLVLNPAGLTVVDVSNPASPAQVAMHPLAIALGSGAIASRNGYLYAVDQMTGLLIFDVTNPATPRKVATIDIPLGNPFIDGDRLFMVWSDGFTIYSLADPLQPVRLGGYTTSFVMGFDVRDHLVFLGGADRYAIRVVDVTDPANPTVVSSYSPDAATAAGGLELVGNHVLLTAVNAAILYDATDPTNIQYIGPVAGSSSDFASDGTHFFVASDKLYAHDLANAPAIAKDSLELWAGSIVASEGRVVHVPGVQLIDARDISNIKMIDQKDWPANSVDLKGSRLYTAGSSAYGYTLGRTKVAVWDADLPELPASPSLSAVFTGGQVVLRWPEGFGPLSLYSTSELNTSWQLVTSSPILDGDHYVYTNRFPTAAAQFYKLAP